MPKSIAELAAVVKRFESDNDYNQKDPRSTASGAYSFLNSTWKNYANDLGIDTSLYPTAKSAPPPVQDAVFAQAVRKNGLNDWTCPGCNPRLSSFLASTDPNFKSGLRNIDTSNFGVGDIAMPDFSGGDTGPAPVVPATPAAPAPTAPQTNPMLLAALQNGGGFGGFASGLNSLIAPQPAAPVQSADQPVLMPGVPLPLSRRLF